MDLLYLFTSGLVLFSVEQVELDFFLTGPGVTGSGGAGTCILKGEFT